MRTVRSNRAIGAVVLAAVCGVVVACTAPTPVAPTTTLTSVPGPPVVNRLSVAAKRQAAPVVGTLSWSIGDHCRQMPAGFSATSNRRRSSR